MDAGFRVRKRPLNRQGMRSKAKPTKSPALTELNKHHDDQTERVFKALDGWLANLGKDYPHGYRGEVFCWLWDNYAAVRHAIERHWFCWETIAELAEYDGVKGRWSKPPTANAMRRVMTRVVAEKGNMMPKTGH